MSSIPIPSYGDLIPLNDFVHMVVSGGFIDYDGTGYYSDGKVYFRNKPAIPSEFTKGNIDRSFAYVMWFNK